MNKKKIIISIIVLTAIILIGGGSYAWFNYYQESNLNNLLIAGNIRLKLEEGTDTVTLTNIFPETKEEARARNDNTLTFTVSGANTSSKSILYQVLLNRGSSKGGSKQRFLDNELRFDLVEISSNNETYLVNNANYSTLSDTIIYDNTVPGSTNSVEHTYRLRVWVDENVIISETETGSHVYTPNEYKNLYATVKLSVKGESVNGASYTVTFNANGGTVPVSTKNVAVGESYGVLPTPVREGYTFLGWNGKNMMTPFFPNRGFTASGVVITSSSWAVTDYIPVDLENNTYVLTLSSDYKTMIGGYNANYEFVGRTTGAVRTSFILNSSTDFSTDATENPGPIRYVLVRPYNSNDLPGIINDINNYQYQMELGNTQTEWEPYYITSDTTVVQNSNHTLKALWQAN